MTPWELKVTELVAQARAELSANQPPAETLDRLRERLLAQPAHTRQRLLYLHAAVPSVRSRVIAAATHEPVPDSVTQIDPLAPEPPYKTVFDAILDGWRVVHFPDQRAPFDDREIDILGYEFVLEKMEVYDV